MGSKSEAERAPPMQNLILISKMPLVFGFSLPESVESITNLSSEDLQPKARGPACQVVQAGSPGKFWESLPGLPDRLALLLWVAKPQRTHLKCFLRLPEAPNQESRPIFGVSGSSLIGRCQNNKIHIFKNV